MQQCATRINAVFRPFKAVSVCNGSKSVTQPDASSKRYMYLGRKYCVRQIVHKTSRTDINSRTLQAAVIV